MEGYLAGAIATWNQGRAGAHLCVLRDGTIVRTVRLEDVAWHAA
jgi:N-acetyl-anhydromuramyl-L-alanine amidase AmpD